MGIKANEKGICPHCKIPNRFENAETTTFREYSKFYDLYVKNGDDDRSTLSMCRCANCSEVIIFFDDQMIYPLGAMRNSAPKEVTEEIANDFNEACLIENLSPKASATLARRCLQNILHNQGINKRNLSQEIDEAMLNLPSHLSESIDAIRNIGNFAAHPMKSTNSGEIIDIEPGETEWILDVIESLFDFYYVQPAITKAKKAKLDAKLQSAGKPNCK